MTHRTLTLAVSAIAIMFAKSSFADVLPVYMPGYQCYHLDEHKLHATKEELFRSGARVSEFDQPHADAHAVGTAMEVVFVKWPIVRENGFVEVLRPNRTPAWIEAALVRPLYKDPGSKGGCKLYWDGHIVRYQLDPGAKAWMFPTGSDMPDGWRMR